MLSRTLVSIFLATAVCAAEPIASPAAEVDVLISKASNYLLAQTQPNGSFMPGDQFVLGVTGLVAEALAVEPSATPASDPRLVKALAFVNGFKQPDGGVYDPTSPLGNYCTSIALLLWTATKSGDPASVTAAQNYLWGIQNKDIKNPSLGGIGYGSKGVGFEDLSNTSWAVNALKTSGVPSTDPRMQQALKFLERCQDLSSVNKLPWAGNSGGAVYSPDESKAAGSWDRTPPKADAPAPKLAPYGSMTYALISSYAVLDLKADDPRVVAALAWVKANYQFDANPGMAAGKEQQGLFYYYLLMSRTYQVTGIKTIDLPNGTKADWRVDLLKAIQQRVTIDGDKAYWANKADRWAEGSPILVTAYVLKALKAIKSSL
ncbi:MAG: prenyltransferase/squalene oxidase repeat-containing protein [Planctomycetota bacterium]